MTEITYGPGGPPSKWEYRLCIVENKDLQHERYLTQPESKPEGGAVEAAMNDLGEDRWELMPSIVQLGAYPLPVFRRLH